MTRASGDNDTLIWSNMCQQGQRALTCDTMIGDNVSVRSAVIIKTTTINHVKKERGIKFYVTNECLELHSCYLWREDCSDK